MKCILRIITECNEHTRLMADFLGGPNTVYHARVVSATVNKNGMRNVLALPRCLQAGYNRASIEQHAIEHLTGFGFKRKDIEVQYRVANNLPE